MAAQPRLGVLLLEGKMAQVSGCMACVDTFPYPVVYKVVPGSKPPSSPEQVEAMVPLYVEAARELEREGIDVLTDNCNGLMVLMQDRLAAAVKVPVVTSSLMLVPEIHRMMPGRRIGLLAFYASALNEQVYNACGWSANDIPTAVGEVGWSEAWHEFLRTKEIPPELRLRLEADLIAVGRRMLEENPDIGAFVSECTLMPPILQALRDELRLPVYDNLTLLDLAVAGRFRPAAALSGVSC